jgi:hypothetical protein
MVFERIALILALLALANLHFGARRIESKIDTLSSQSFLHVRRKDQP